MKKVPPIPDHPQYLKIGPSGLLTVAVTLVAKSAMVIAARRRSWSAWVRVSLVGEVRGLGDGGRSCPADWNTDGSFEADAGPSVR